MKYNLQSEIRDSAQICRRERDIQRAIEIHSHYLAKQFGVNENKIYIKLKGLVYGASV